MKLLPFADYAKEETLRVRAELPAKGAHDLRFVFITDLHYKFIDEMQASVSNTVHAINELNKSEKIDFVPENYTVLIRGTWEKSPSTTS